MTWLTLEELWALEDFLGLWHVATVTPGHEVWVQRPCWYLPLYRPLTLSDWQAWEWRVHTSAATT